MTRPIGVGVCILPDRPWAQARQDWLSADELGFDHAWTYDHLTWGGLPDSPWFAAVPTLAAAALETRRIRLGTFVSSPNTHHPAQLVRESLSLHDLSGGRLLLGVGAGGDTDARLTSPHVSAGARSARFREFVTVVDRMLREDGISHHGPCYDLDGAGSLPGPPNAGEQHGIPLLVAANGPRAIALAAERGDGWITYGGKADDDAAWWALVAGAAGRLDAEVSRAGRNRPLRRYLGLDSQPTYPFSSADCFEDAAGRAAALGFTDVVCSWPRPEPPYAGDIRVVEEVASRRRA